jgi:hypothetical protein
MDFYDENYDSDSDEDSYSTPSKRSMKWYIRIFYHFLEMILHNSFILFTFYQEEKKTM